MALLLALSANIGVGTMVSSFRLTFTGWLDQRLASELYVGVADREMAGRMEDYLDGVGRSLPIWSVDADILGAPGEIYSVADDPTYRDNWPLIASLPDSWDRVAAGDGAMINEQLARREGLSPGDRLPLPGGALTVAGVYSDYGNPVAQVLIRPDLLVTRFPDVERLDFGLRVPPAQVDAVRRDLVEVIGVDPERVIDQAALKAFSLGVFERTFAVTAALNVLTLTVAGFAILTSLLTLSSMRLPQLAPVWAHGLTRASLARIELLRALLLAVLTWIVSIPVGLMLAWVLLAVVNVEAFGWRLPLHLFPADWARLGLLSVLAAGLAAAWPAWRLSRIAPARLIGVFAHER